MMSGKAGGASRRFFSQAVLLVTILPLWALWVYAYSTLESFQREVDSLPRFYGMYLYKEDVRARLEEAARRVGRLEAQGAHGVEWEETDERKEELRENLRLLFGPEEGLLVVERGSLRVLYPPEASGGPAGFLNRPDTRKAFLRTLQRMAESGSESGFFSIDTSDESGGSHKRCWFLAMEPVGEDLLILLPVPEERLRKSGLILEEAQGSLLKERRKRFVRLTLPVVLLSSVFIGILHSQRGRPNRGRRT